MYEVYIEAAEFKGLRVIQQHKLVTEALKEEIKAMHGVRISTAVPKN
jgi:BolA-like protein 3